MRHYVDCLRESTMSVVHIEIPADASEDDVYFYIKTIMPGWTIIGFCTISEGDDYDFTQG